MTINLFYLDRRAILIGSVQLVLLGKTKKKGIKCSGIKDLMKFNIYKIATVIKKIPSKKFLWECVCYTENIHLICAQEGKHNNEVLSSFACYPEKGNISKYKVF